MNFNIPFCGGFAATALALSVTAASAEVVATDAAGVMKALQDYGYVATMETDSRGNPKIASRVSDTKFKVYFFGCNDDGKKCTSIQLGAGYDLNTGTNALKINEWNRDKRFAKAYIDDEGDPFLEMDINLDFDGTGDKNFQDSLDLWRLLVEDFEVFIDW